MTVERVGCLPPSRARQRGATLLEVLVGCLIVAIGWLGAAQLQLQLRQGTDLARQQAEAGRLALHRLEQLRARAARPALAESGSDWPGSDATSGEFAAADTRYRLEATLRDGVVPGLTEVDVNVRWPDATGIEQRIAVSSALEPQSAALALPLTVARTSRHTGPVGGRHAAIPRDAIDLGDGRSLFRPARADTRIWLFDNQSARIVAHCGVPVEVAPAQLARTDLSGCIAQAGLLIAGRVRTAPELGADPLRAEVGLQHPDGSPAAADCVAEAVRMVDPGPDAAPRPLAVGVAATPAGHGLTGWREIGDRFLRYHCAVPADPASSGRRPNWSGRLSFTPIGWTIGHGAGSHRVCRYSVDSDASGAIDRAAESPDIQRAVDEALVEQNYLIVAGPEACPREPGHAVTVPHHP